MRNKSPFRRVVSSRQLRERFDEFLRLFGHLLPVCSMKIDAKSRGNAICIALKPEAIPKELKSSSNVGLRVWVFFQPGNLCCYTPFVKFSSHAIERVVQRAHIVETPVTAEDIQAINAEFSDAVLLAVFALEVLDYIQEVHGDEAKSGLQVIIPSAHGAFLGNWLSDEKFLLIKTFIDREKLNEPQLEALRELRLITDADLSSPMIEMLAPTWFGSQVLETKRNIADAWRHYGWRFEEDRLHPGLSDKAWKDRPQ
jgi:hypothetical protein